MPSPADDPALIQHIFRWDLDKTYLHTDFDSWIDLVRTAVEKPERKRTVPGAAALIRELRATVPSIVTILSGSPEQMRLSLEAKLRLDGIQWDEFVLKPSLRHILRGRFRALRDQVGYKLPALLAARVRAPSHAPETLFGDDAEADGLIYSLYADILGDRVNDRTLTAVLEHAHTYPDVISETIRLVHKVTRTDPVRRIFIHLDRKSEPAFFRIYGPRVVPVYNYFQAAAVLVEDGILAPLPALRVGGVLVVANEFSVEDLASSVRDLVTRGHLGAGTVRTLRDALGTVTDPFALDAKARDEFLTALDASAWEAGEAPARAEIDYLAALSDDRARWEAARQRAKAGVRPANEPPEGER
jgi:hypothetical protein